MSVSTLLSDASLKRIIIGCLFGAIILTTIDLNQTLKLWCLVGLLGIDITAYIRLKVNHWQQTNKPVKQRLALFLTAMLIGIGLILNMIYNFI